MRKLFSFILILILTQILISISKCYAEIGVNSKISIELGYFTFLKKSLRTNYEQNLLPFSNNIVPLSVGLGYQRAVNPKNILFFRTRLIRNQLINYSKFAITSIPLILGIHHYLPWTVFGTKNRKIYVGFGVSYYMVFISEEVYVTLETGPEVVDHLRKVLVQNGIGLNFDFDFQLNENYGIILNYDFSRIGNIKKGGLGNIGGLLFSLIFSFGF